MKYAIKIGCILAISMSSLSYGMEERNIMKFCTALVSNDAEWAQKMIHQGLIKTNALDNTGWTPLMYAAKTGCVQMVSDLLAKGADPDRQNPKGRTALELAASEGFVEIVKLLLQYKAYSTGNRIKEAEAAALAYAYRNRDNKFFLLLQDGVKLSLKDTKKCVLQVLKSKVKKIFGDADTITASSILNDAYDLKAQLLKIPPAIVKENKIRQYCHIHGCQLTVLQKIGYALKNASRHTFGPEIIHYPRVNHMRMSSLFQQQLSNIEITLFNCKL